MKRSRFNRRRMMSGLGSGVFAAGSGWLPRIAAAAKVAGGKDRNCILLWMAGGPSQLDTFDMKPDHANGGPIKPIQTNVPGIFFSEHLGRLSGHADSLAIMRGLTTKEGDHGRGTVLMRTGHAPGGPVAYPSIGCSLSKELGRGAAELPDYVSVAPGPFSRLALRPGFLGPKYAATSVMARPAGEDGYPKLDVDYLQRDPGVDDNRNAERLRLWESMQKRFRQGRPSGNVIAHDTVYESAIRMLQSDAREAFDLSGEPAGIRESYGKTAFGQGCLLARRLVERGVSVVEVSSGNGLGWDTHADNFARVKTLSEELDLGWATLMQDLRDRGLLETTTILWAGEFGRTPIINATGGRDHYPQAFSCVLAGGGIAGGQTHGQTSEDGSEVTDGQMNQQDLLATLCAALGVDPWTENVAEGGRPIAIAEGDVIDEVLL